MPNSRPGLIQTSALGSGLIDPEQHSGCDDDGRHESMGASVVARCDPAPILELCKHVFDTRPLSVELGVVGKLDLAVLASGDAGLDPFRLKSLTVPVAVVAAISDELLGGWQGIQREGSAF